MIMIDFSSTDEEQIPDIDDRDSDQTAISKVLRTIRIILNGFVNRNMISDKEQNNEVRNALGSSLMKVSMGY
jgi:hypothetical protein